MPWILASLALGAHVVLAAPIAAITALGRAAGAKTVAFLEGGPVLNVVWDGIRWRPMGSVDLAAVIAWNAAGHSKAEINGSEVLWTGAGFSSQWRASSQRKSGACWRTIDAGIPVACVAAHRRRFTCSIATIFPRRCARRTRPRKRPRLGASLQESPANEHTSQHRQEDPSRRVAGARRGARRSGARWRAAESAAAMTRAWYAVQIFQPPLGQAKSLRGEAQESEAQAVARMHSLACKFEAAATLWVWNGRAWVHVGPWAWVNPALYRQLVSQNAGRAASTWGRA